MALRVNLFKSTSYVWSLLYASFKCFAFYKPFSTNLHFYRHRMNILPRAKMCNRFLGFFNFVFLLLAPSVAYCKRADDIEKSALYIWREFLSSDLLYPFWSDTLRCFLLVFRFFLRFSFGVMRWRCFPLALFQKFESKNFTRKKIQALKRSPVAYFTRRLQHVEPYCGGSSDYAIWAVNMFKRIHVEVIGISCPNHVAV